VVFVFAAAYMTTAVAYLIAVEVLIVIDVILGAGRLTTGRVWAVVSVLGIIVIIDVAVEVLPSVEPGTRADEDPAGKPLGTVVTVRGTPIGSSFIVAVWAVGSRPNVDADLSLGFRSCKCEAESSNCDCGENFSSVHFSPLPCLEQSEGARGCQK
jgi:hypothetical protein